MFGKLKSSIEANCKPKMTKKSRHHTRTSPPEVSLIPPETVAINAVIATVIMPTIPTVETNKATNMTATITAIMMIGVTILIKITIIRRKIMSTSWKRPYLLFRWKEG